MAIPAGGTFGLVDLTTVFQQPKIVLYWAADLSVSWLDATTVVAALERDGRLLRFRVSSETPEEIAIAGGSANRDVQPLQRLR